MWGLPGEATRDDPAGAGGREFGAERNAGPGSRRGPPAAARVFMISEVPLPQGPPTQRGDRGPEAAPTVGSVLPLVLHGRVGRGGESEPERPQPARAGGSAGCSAPPRARPLPARLASPARCLQWEPGAGGGGTRGGAGLGRGWGPNLCFPSGLKGDSPGVFGGLGAVVTRSFIYPPVHSSNRY